MGYCTIQDMRDEGFLIADYPDDWVTAKIALATAYIDKITQRWFEPRDMTLRVDGIGSSTLRLAVPGIIEIDSVRTIGGLGDNFDADDVDLDDIVVYNRHLTMGLLEPDDRANPRLETFVTDDRLGRSSSTAFGNFYLFPKGRQNIEVGGTFGYTELAAGATPGETTEGSQVPDSQGITPPLICEACKRLVARDLEQLAESEERSDVRNEFRVTAHKTRHQSIKFTSLEKLAMNGFATGDPEIDGLLALYTGGSGTKVSAV